MKVLIDACVLYPTLLREILIGAAKAGLYEPFWSERILGEWRHAMARDGDEGRIAVDAAIALLSASFRGASVSVPEGLDQTFHLPDPDDRHVLAAAVAGDCDELLTLNLKDFPTRTLGAHGILRRDPDGFLVELFAEDPETVRQLVFAAVAEARTRKPDVMDRALLKRARLPRLGKALYG